MLAVSVGAATAVARSSSWGQGRARQQAYRPQHKGYDFGVGGELAVLMASLRGILDPRIRRNLPYATRSSDH